MPITEEQRERRRMTLGSSDMAAVLGVDPFGRNAGDVFLEKTEDLKPLPAKQWLAAGNYFEDGLLDWATEKLGPLRRNQQGRDIISYLTANTDAVVISTEAPVEGKVYGLFGPLSEAWGDEGTDQVPAHVIIQAHVHMICTEGNTPKCHVPTFLCGRGFCMFEVEADEALCCYIRETAKQFWEENVIPKVAPSMSVPHIETLKRRKRVSGVRAAIPVGLIGEYELATADAKASKQHRDECHAALVAGLGGCEWGEDEDGRFATYLEQSARKADPDKLRAAGLFNEYSKASESRTLRLPKTEPKT